MRRTPIERAADVIETAWELVADDLPEGWSVTVVAIDPAGRVVHASDAPDLVSVAHRLARVQSE